MEAAKTLANKIFNYSDKIENQKWKYEIDIFVSKLPFSGDFSWENKQGCFVCQHNINSDKNMKILVYKLGEKDGCVFFSSEYYIVKKALAIRKRMIQKSFTILVNDAKLTLTDVEYFNEKIKTKETRIFENGELVLIEKFKDNPQKDHIVESKISRKEKFFFGTKIAISKKDGSKLVTKYDGSIKDMNDFSLELLDRKSIAVGRKKSL